jgi:hypothetical protein
VKPSHLPTGIRASAVERTLPDEFRLGNRSERCRKEALGLPLNARSVPEDWSG